MRIASHRRGAPWKWVRDETGGVAGAKRGAASLLRRWYCITVGPRPDQPSVIVVGGGTKGLACTRALARRGVAVTMLERFGHEHDRGSHSGHTRVIRQADHEGSSYVPLIQQADRDWRAQGERHVAAMVLDDEAARPELSVAAHRG